MYRATLNLLHDVFLGKRCSVQNLLLKCFLHKDEYGMDQICSFTNAKMQSFISIVYSPYFDFWDATSVFILLKTPKANQLFPWPTPMKIGNSL
jgi:hypothetical protein